MDWIGFLAGAALGALASTAYFAALALNVQTAGQSARPVALLLGGAFLRIAMLLLAGWATVSLGLWSTLGFAAAFPLVRSVAIRLARVPNVTDA